MDDALSSPKPAGDEPFIVKADEVDDSGADISTISIEDVPNEEEFHARIELRRAHDAVSDGDEKVLANAVQTPLSQPSPRRQILVRDATTTAPPVLDTEATLDEIQLLADQDDAVDQEHSTSDSGSPTSTTDTTGTSDNAEFSNEAPTDSLSLGQLRKLVGEWPRTEEATYQYNYTEAGSFMEEIQEWFEYAESDYALLNNSRDDFESQWQQFAKNTDLSWRAASPQQQYNFVRSLTDNPETYVSVLSHLLLGCWHEVVEDGEVCCPSMSAAMIEAAQASPFASQICRIFDAVDRFTSTSLISTVIEALLTCWNRERTDEDDSIFQKLIELHRILTCLYVIVETSRWMEPTSQQKIRHFFLTTPVQLHFELTKMLAAFRWEEQRIDTDAYRQKLLILCWKSLLVTFGSLEVAEASRALLDPTHNQQQELRTKTVTASPLDYHAFRQEIISKYPAYVAPNISDNECPIIVPSGNRKEAMDLPEEQESTPASILTQPVHIATPIPSPPPSPAGPGGKLGKRQNYQTNQNFPFLYPSPDSAQKTASWRKENVPASITEAGDLFARRTQMPRSLRQMWDARRQYDVDQRVKPSKGIVNDEPDLGESIEARLRLVQRFYHQSLPFLDSLVAEFQHVMVQILVGMQAGGSAVTTNSSMTNLAEFAMKKSNPATTPYDPSQSNAASQARAQEISLKAMLGTALLLLKWFKLNHVLCAEYFSQLLLDRNLMPYILKFLALQDVEKTVAHSKDQPNLDFFAYCKHSANADDAMPPSIPRHRLSSPERKDGMPIDLYAPRFFLININMLRLLQKMTKRKAHRILLLIQYKSSPHLRKTLKIPEPMLRLYTLKLFKSQVPYCGRKWRSANMRVLTAIYLHCRPGLRDEWLCGGDVDGNVDEALSVEQAGRNLVHWWHMKHFSDAFGTSPTGRSANAEGDGSGEGFFAAELARLAIHANNERSSEIHDSVKDYT